MRNKFAYLLGMLLGFLFAAARVPEVTIRHAAFISQPSTVAKFIEQAAARAK